jgi:hypothetical protein
LRGGEGCEIGRVGVADARGGWGAGVARVGRGVLYVWEVSGLVGGWVGYLGEQYGGGGGRTNLDAQWTRYCPVGS